MAQKESHAERTERSSLPNLMPTEFAELGKKRIEEFVNTQKGLVEKLQEMNRQWFDRAQAEANLASELASKLTAARSIPDAMAAYQEWASRRFEMMAEDGKHLLADTQKFMEAATHLLPNASLIKGGGGSST
jgi:DNA topoisomerase VI subunit B